MSYGPAKHSETNAVLNALFDAARPALAVHRGAGHGGIIENTVNAVTAAVRCGADIVEIDIVESIDGEYFVFHDGYEKKWFGIDQPLTALSSAEIASLSYPDSQGQRVERLDTLLDACPDTILNIDRSWRYWPRLLEWFDRHAEPQQLLLKAAYDEQGLDALAAHPVPYPLLLIAHAPDQVENVAARETINLVGAELIVRDHQHVFVDRSYLQHLRTLGLFSYINALDLGDGVPLSAGWDDSVSVLSSPASGWGELLARQYDVIQTDWPMLLREYIAARAGTPDA